MLPYRIYCLEEARMSVQAAHAQRPILTWAVAVCLNKEFLFPRLFNIIKGRFVIISARIGNSFCRTVDFMIFRKIQVKKLGHVSPYPINN